MKRLFFVITLIVAGYADASTDNGWCSYPDYSTCSYQGQGYFVSANTTIFQIFGVPSSAKPAINGNPWTLINEGYLVWENGARIDIKGFGVIATPEVEKGRTYTYDLELTVKDDSGMPATKWRRVNFKAGQNNLMHWLDFYYLPETVQIPKTPTSSNTNPANVPEHGVLTVRDHCNDNGFLNTSWRKLVAKDPMIGRAFNKMFYKSKTTRLKNCVLQRPQKDGVPIDGPRVAFIDQQDHVNGNFQHQGLRIEYTKTTVVNKAGKSSDSLRLDGFVACRNAKTCQKLGIPVVIDSVR